MILIRLIFSITLTLLSTQTFSSTWNCRNNDIEIYCNSNKCKVSDSFTPINIDVSTNGNLNICAYSGCWSGKGKVIKSGKNILVSGINLEWSGTSSSNADFIVVVGEEDKVGFIKGYGFSMPTTCIRTY